MRLAIAAVGAWCIPLGLIALAYQWSYADDLAAGLACMGGLWLAGALMVFEACRDA